VFGVVVVFVMFGLGPSSSPSYPQTVAGPVAFVEWTVGGVVVNFFVDAGEEVQALAIRGIEIASSRRTALRPGYLTASIMSPRRAVVKMPSRRQSAPTRHQATPRTPPSSALAQAYWMPNPPGQGAEVFSLLRESELPTSEYLNRFFDTGAERQTRQGDDAAD
jgi:hypothetical protein